MREVISTGKTVDEATEKACAELGRPRDEVSVEILERPVKKLFKSIAAKVKVTLLEEEVEEDIFKVSPPPASVVPVVAATPVKKAEAFEKKEPPISPSVSPAVSSPTREEHRETVLEKEPEIAIDLSQNESAQKAVLYLASIFEAAGAHDVKIEAFQQGDATLLRVEGEEISNRLETRGETIQALSYLTDRAVNRGIDKKDGQYLRVRLDIAGYRNRRERELTSLAERTGREVAKTKKSRTLSPMNPYERLIIHTRISEMDGVISESIGSDTERRVVIKSTAPDAKNGDDWNGGAPKGDHRRPGDAARRGGKSGPPRGDRDRRSSSDRGDRGSYSDKPRSNTPDREFANRQRDESAAPVVPKRRDAISDGDDLPLYGKIDI